MVTAHHTRAHHTRTASAALLAVLAFAGCGSREATMESSATASTESSAATSAPPAPTQTPVTTSTSAAQPAGQKVGPADLPAIVSDRTFRGADGTETYSEYYAPDGSVRGKSGTEVYSGSWAVVGEQLCFTYAQTGESATECYTVFRDGDVLTWVDENGELVETTYVEGNPDQL